MDDHTRPPPDLFGPVKLALRDQLLADRKRTPLALLGERARARAAHLLAAEEVRRAATVAAYVSVGSEPGTGPLLDGLDKAGKRVIVPRLLPGNDLDWVTWTGSDDLVAVGRGLLEPGGPSLGVGAVATADAVLVPGLAVDQSGTRLGRGGGSYDRALARVPVGTFVCVLLNSEEILDRVPREAHDRPVSAVATEDGVTRLAGV